jgi:hypothetical protein
MTDLETYLAAESEKRVAPGDLRLMGKKAAAKFVSDEVPLNESIADLAKESSLNEEQVKRVVEHANTNTFLELFGTDYDNNIDFPVADSGQVQEIMLPEEKVASPIPLIPKNTYVPGQEYVSLEDVFSADSEIEKVAEDDSWTSNDKKEYFEAMYKTKQASADVLSATNQFELQVERVKQAMDDALREDSHPYEILSLIKEAGVSRELMEVLIDGKEDEYTGFGDLDLTDFVINADHLLYKEAYQLNDALEILFEKKAELSSIVDSADIKRKDDLKAMLAAAGQ